MSEKDIELPKLLSEIGRAMYAYSEELPEEEKWSIQSKLRTRSNDAIAWTAEALGSVDPRDIKWALGKARASLFVVEATYKHACNVGLLVLSADVMVQIQKAVKEMDQLLVRATADIPSWFVEMEPSQKGSKQ